MWRRARRRWRASPRAAATDASHVLVVDDHPKDLIYVRGSREDAGYRTVVTGDPEDVADLLEMHRPDLVVLDLLLPGADGIELMQSRPALADRPVMFMSAYGRDEMIARAGERSGRLRGQAVLGDGARGQSRDGPEQVDRVGRALQCRRARHRPRGAPGQLGRQGIDARRQDHRST